MEKTTKEKLDKAKKLEEEVKEAAQEMSCDAPWSDVDTKIHGPHSC